MKNMKNSTLVVCVGLPASGKSTYAKDLVKREHTFIRLNKDDLRCMFAGVWSSKMEGFVIDVQTQIALKAVADKKDIVIDDTNLNPKVFDKWQTFARYHNYCFCEMSFKHVPIQTCIDRDACREKPVGKDVILNMAFQYGLAKQEKQFVICDLDGTLADITERKKKSTLPNGKLNWDEFFNPDNISLDVPRYDVIQQVSQHCIDNNTDLFVVSGRSDRTREATRYWLAKYGILPDRLIMRPAGDSTPDDELKEKWLNTYLDKTMCVKVFDDRPRVISMWKRNGLEVIDVGNGVDF